MIDLSVLTQEVLAGQKRALARAITHVENGGSNAAQILAALYPHSGRAHRVGVTGAPGTGKSTLVNVLAQTMRARDLTVGIVAVDPTSPYSGGAILGDRIRMNDLAGDKGVFIRSMATRGTLGGLAATTSDVVEVLDAAGFDVILIETVGAGQAEVDIARTAHTTIVVEAPGLGDEVQAIKAGILEVADVLVLNKADHPLADNAFRALRTMVDLGSGGSRLAHIGHHSMLAAAPEINDNQSTSELAVAGWEVLILKTVATVGEGIADLFDTIVAHKSHLESSGELAIRDRSRIVSYLESSLSNALLKQLLMQVGLEQIERTVDDLLARRTDPHTAVASLIQTISQTT